MNADATQHAALTSIAERAIRALPTRSAIEPAAADPMAPLAMVRNAIADPRRGVDVAAANAAIQVHIA